MAYSIILNLSGNAVANTERLYASLSKANAQAGLLSKNLAAIGASARAIPNRTIRFGGQPASNSQQIRANQAAVATAAAAKSTAVAATATAKAATATATSARAANYTRHRSTRIASWGSGFSLGPFSGRLSTIIQPDANGQIFGLNADKLMKSVNVAGIATSIVGSIGKAIFKVVKYATIAPLAVGGGALAGSIRLLQSESFAEGVRLISRRHQAQQGLGDEFFQAQSNADFLAATFGLDRSTTLSSINTFTGLGIAGTNRQIDLNEATGLTKVAGLISQHHGVPFERVATNLQQLLVQDRPHIRDIRELLNQAPILGKYALREINEKGLTGVDVRSYLKDQRNIFSVLKSYELDVATNAGMQARGRISLAQQDAYAKIAGNNPFWSLIGERGSGTIGAIGNAANNIMTRLANAPEFQVLLHQIELTIDRFGTKGLDVFEKLSKILDRLAEKYGLLSAEDKQEARFRNDIENAIKTATKDPYIEPIIRKMWEDAGLATATRPDDVEKQFTQFYNDALRYLQKSETVRESVIPLAPYQSLGKLPWYEQINPFNTGIGNEYAFANRVAQAQARSALYDFTGNYVEGSRYMPTVTNLKQPTSAYAGYITPQDKLIEALAEYLQDVKKVGTIDPSLIPSSGAGEAGDDLKGFNRDRRSLEIHFNAPIVQWDSTINTNNAQESYDYIEEQLPELVASSIQKALLGSTNTMNNRF